jgi:hypothetical protein
MAPHTPPTLLATTDVVFTNANSLYKGSAHPFTSNQVTTNAVPPTKSLMTPKMLRNHSTHPWCYTQSRSEEE